MARRRSSVRAHKRKGTRGVRRHTREGHKQLTHMATDPNGKGRGAGRYYHRGHGRWSKYSPDLDRQIKARTKGSRYASRGRWGHWGDKSKTI